MNQARDVDNRVVTAASHASNKVLSVCAGEHPAIARFPVVIQKLLVPEVLAVEERIAEGKDTPEFNEELTCYCSFARRYLLPCRHIFHLNTVTPVLTPEKWDYYVSMFEEGGMEVYESITAVHIAEQPPIPNGGRVESLLEMREIEERLHQQLYAVHEILDERQVPEDKRREVLREWVGHVRVTVASLLLNVEPEEIVERNRPWEL
ncbi:hypothetical protein FN846DRAFT_913747 [Sphaerosporella brunnea]|uniref:Uncharacterized protein n=1 Tax=Sphaerosporella brunnea TaxID=1250544 RepID=A0A5J5EFK4_9PEZI|nr:hypothetical protein FN846DRAFT_913747 [Sphaerosporella brunnea]